MGLDCGGSSTRVRVEDDSGTVVFSGEAGGANLATMSGDDISEHIAKATDGAPAVDACYGCFAGLLTANDRYRAIGILEQSVQSQRFGADPDFAAALAADPKADHVLISGTGCIVACRQQGKLVKTGGGGPLLGDQGSVFDLVRIVFQNTFLVNRTGDLTKVFSQSLADQFGTADRDQILANLYGHPSPAAKLAKLAPAILLDYHAGASYARQAVYTLMGRIFELLTAHIQSFPVQQSTIELRLTGGLWDIDPVFLGLFDEFLQNDNALQSVKAVQLNVQPVLGAVNLAKQLQ